VNASAAGSAPGLRPAVFLDRDGTVIEDRNYARTAAEIVLLDGAGDAISALNRALVPAVLISNQSGVGRGFFTLADLSLQHAELARQLAAWGAVLDGIYICPHRPEEGCACRKPGPALIEQAAVELGLDLGLSWMVGDKAEDLALAERGLAGAVLVRTGRGAETADRLAGSLMPARVVPDLRAAVALVLRALGR
jgi:D-glycero-D-manno-heptose 1,7-bisphosphate phosphatase